MQTGIIVTNKPFKVSVESSGDSLEEAVAALRAHVAKIGSVKSEVPKVETDETLIPAESEETPTEKKRGRPPGKKSVEAPVAEEKPVELPEITSPKEPLMQVTKDDAYQALTRVNAKKQLDGVRAVLAKFSVERFSALKEEDYRRFVDECNKSVG